ncbi:MAG: HD domain-containing protein [Herpetosiphon sp.]
MNAQQPTLPPTTYAPRRSPLLDRPTDTSAVDQFDETQVRLAEVLSALTYALDLTEGHPPGHTLGSTVIGMRIGVDIGLDATELEDLYYTLLLKDVGCSSNAARIALLFGSDDQRVKHNMKLADWQHRVPLALRTATNVGRGQRLRTRVSHFATIARTPDVTREFIAVRCERGAEIGLGLGFPAATADAIRAVDEHWNGQGYPYKLHSTAIPLLARIANLAQCVQLFFGSHGQLAALRMVRDRRGSWFDPQLVDLVLSWKHDADWWKGLISPSVGASVIAADPRRTARRLDSEGVDHIARAFADIIDAKSPFTFRHSVNVAAYARSIAEQLGVAPVAAHRLYRAGLVHDIGKLGVSNRILDKNGALTADERLAIEQHPVHTWEILARVPAFDDFAWLAAVHHEKLDGSGYPWGLRAPDLDLPARILTVADMYEALTADRPYRHGLIPTEALAILRREENTRLDAQVIAALAAII